MILQASGLEFCFAALALALDCVLAMTDCAPASALSGDAKIKQLLHNVDQQQGLGLVAIVEQILDELQGMGLAWESRIRPSQVGVDPSNRDGVGVNAADVHSLGADILAMGFSWKQVASAVCIEEAPGATDICDFNKMLSHGCDSLPNSGLDHVRFGSVACSHTNMFLRCVAAGVESSHEELCEGGRLCLEKIARRDPEFGRAVREGVGMEGALEQSPERASKVAWSYPKSSQCTTGCREGGS